MGDVGGETGRGEALGDGEYDPDDPGDAVTDLKLSSLKLVVGDKNSLSL